MAKVVKNFIIDVFLKHDFILLSAFERKTAFLAIYKPESA
jgi:hypothetical protein